MRQFVQGILLKLPRWMQSNLFPVLLTLRVGGLLLAALSLWGFAELAEEVLEQESIIFDQNILLFLQQFHHPFLDSLMLGLTFLGEPGLLAILVAIIAPLLLLRHKSSEATVLLIAAAGAGGLNYWLKALFGRDRPLLWERIIDVQLYSFPSGHAMVSMVVYSIIAYLLILHFPHWRNWIIAATLVLVAGIGLSRLYLGVHWPTDVIGGYAAGIVWVIACLLSLEVWKARAEIRSALNKK